MTHPPRLLVALSLVGLIGCNLVIQETPPQLTRPGSQPVLGATVSTRHRAVPISGGTLQILSSGLALAADPERDAVFVADLSQAQAVRQIALRAGDEPGRSVEDLRGHVHVVLRGAGAVAVVDPSAGSVVSRREVCVSPRGIAYDRAHDLVHVACAGGELVSMEAQSGAVTRSLKLAQDLRDIVALPDGRLLVTQFRSAKVITVTAEGRALDPVAPTTFERNSGFSPTIEDRGGASQPVAPARAEPSTAWRMVAGLNGQVVMVHQRALDKEISIVQGGYGGTGRQCGSGGIVESAVSVFSTNGSERPAVVSGDSPIVDAVLAVDVAVSSLGTLAFAIPGNARVASHSQVMVHPGAGLTERLNCIGHENLMPRSLPGQATAVAFVGEAVVLQLREPAALYLPGTNRTIALSRDSRNDTGLTIFHSDSGSGLACASCHAEGDEDGRVWNFASIGPRRTQAFRGGLSGTEPFHWDGDMQSISHLMSSVFSERMSGPILDQPQVAALQGWIDRLPARAPMRAMDPVAARGQTLFHDPVVGCASCHGGAQGTNNQTVDVGTGAAFQVPSLRGLAWRSPFMHNGCAATLRARFSDPQCGGGERHGRTAHLNGTQLDELVSYLETL
ncbi:MAG: cytochrome c [Deltaproteobacteria bacterium]|nr:cytochrome c [Deltaproteobacteria bacterium]